MSGGLPILAGNLVPRPMLTDRDREALHRLAAEWRSESAPEDRGARTRETIIGLMGGEGEHLDRHAAYLLALSLVELLSPERLPPRAGPIVLRALESLADGEGGREYVKIMNDMRGLPGVPALPDPPVLPLPPGMGSSGAGDARAEPGSEGAGESALHDPASRAERDGEAGNRDPAPPSGKTGAGESPDPARRLAAITERILREAAAGEPSPAGRAAGSPGADVVADPAGGASAAWAAPPPRIPDPGTGEHAVANLPGVDIEALARRTMQFAGNGARDGSRDRAPDGRGALTAERTSGSGIVREGPHPTGAGARSRAPSTGKALGGDARDRAPATPGLEPVLFLESAGERFALRAGDVTEVLGAGAHDAARTDGRPPVFVHHGESYHFVDLARALALGDTGESGPARVVVLLRRGGRRVALLCGGVDGREELPVHALPPMVPREALATAAVIAGDGRPILLLDTAALAQYAGG